MNSFGFKRDDGEKRASPGLDTEAAASNPAQPKQAPSGALYAALLALVPVGIIVAITLAMSGRTPGSASATIADVEASVDDERFVEPSDDRAPLRERFAGGTVSSAEDADERLSDLDDDDEFDVNDIVTYERITGKSYSGRTGYAREADAVEQADALERLPFAQRKAGGTPGHPAQGAPAQQAYQCANSSGKPGMGTGRLSRESEYSPFLKKAVRAGEFVIFRYEGAGKEYWFKASNCVRLG